jgi:uncharacterized membrane protein
VKGSREEKRIFESEEAGSYVKGSREEKRDYEKVKRASQLRERVARGEIM